MAQDYSKSQVNKTSNFPDRAIDGQDFGRNEPLLTPELLISRHLNGIPLISDVVDPVTRKRKQITNEELKDIIIGAINQLESDSLIDIIPVKRSESAPFDRNTFLMWGYLRTKHAPISSVDLFSVRPGTNQDIYTVPLEWLSTSNFVYGQLNIIPIMPITSSNFSLSPAGQGGGAVFLAFLNQLPWIPTFWNIEYSTGFADGTVPRVVNELIGCYAAIEVLGMLEATSSLTSKSMGLDGLSQSTGSPGPERFSKRITDLENKKKRLMGKMRAIFGKKFILGTI